MALRLGTRTAQTGSLGVGDVGLTGRGEKLRRLGEIIVLLGLALLLLWDDAAKISPTVANFRGLIHVPTEVIAFFHPDHSLLRETRVPWPGEMRDVSAPVELIILLSALSAVFRRRLMAIWCHLAFFLFPWPLLGIDLGIAQIGVVGLLIALVVDAAGKRDKKRMLVLGGCIVTTLVWFQGVEMLNQSDPRSVYIALPRDQNTHVAEILTGSGNRMPKTQIPPSSVRKGLAYVAAQEAALRDKPDAALEYMIEAEGYNRNESRIEDHRLSAVRVYLAEKNVGTADHTTVSRALIDLVILKLRLFMVAAIVALTGGVVLQTLAGWIGERSKRMVDLTGRLQAHGQISKERRPMPANMQNASLDFTAEVLAIMRRRTQITFLIGLSGLALGTTLLFLSWIFWVPDSEYNTAFATIHVLEDFASQNTPAMTHNAWLRMQDRPPSLWSMVATPLVLFAGLSLLVLRQYRKLLLVIAAYCAWCLYGILTPTTNGMVELPVSAMNIAAISDASAPLAKSSATVATSKGKDSTNYTLSQAAYLSNNLTETEKRLATLIDSGFRKMNAFEWRYVAMSDWVSQKRGSPMIASRLRPNFVLFQTLSNFAGMAAIVVGILATISVLISATLFLRLRRLRDFINEISIGAALQRSRSLM